MKPIDNKITVKALFIKNKIDFKYILNVSNQLNKKYLFNFETKDLQYELLQTVHRDFISK